MSAQSHDGGSCCHVNETAETTVIDPVCGMTVDPAKTAHHSHHGDADFHFCSAGCLAKFTADPGKYLSNTPQVQPVAASGAMWTCPMHPEVRRQGPGTCPICGMALEPEEPSLDDAPNSELVDFTRRWWVAAVLAVPLLILTMGSELLGLHLVSPTISPWLQLALTAPIVLWAGWPFFVRGWTSIVTRRLNMFTLIAIGVGAAFLYSLVATLAPGLFPPAFRMHGMVPVYYEAAGVVVALVLLGQVLDREARLHAPDVLLAQHQLRKGNVARGTEHELGQ